MTHDGLDLHDKETLIRLVLAQVETIAALTKQCETLLARVGELEAKLACPPRRRIRRQQRPRAMASASRMPVRIDGCTRIRHQVVTSRRTPASIAAPMFATPAARLRSLRPYRNSSDQARRDAGDALWRRLPVLRQEVQGSATSGYAQGLAVRGKSAGPRHLSALHAGDRFRANGDVVVRHSRA